MTQVSLPHPECRPGLCLLRLLLFMDKSACLSVARICVFVKLCPKISTLFCDDVCSQ